MPTFRRNILSPSSGLKIDIISIFTAADGDSVFL
jgi:hypothetical protein